MATFPAVDRHHFARLVKEMNDPDPLDPALTMVQQGRLSVQYAPFDYISPTARIVTVGITPGSEQARRALRTERDLLRKGVPLAMAERGAKLAASFSGGQMRRNIVSMLDHVGVNDWLKVTSCGVLFDDPTHEDMHFTSLLRYPVFVDGKNYNGTPDPLDTPLLREMVETFLGAEARALPNALWLPLGPKPTAALGHLVRIGALAADRVLAGLPHPSGANAERISFFLGRKARTALSVKTRPEPIESARDLLVAQVARLASG